MKQKIPYLLLFLAVSLIACKNTSEVLPETVTWEVADAWVACEGVAPQQCLQVRPQGSTEWMLLYDPIENFNYDPGYEYVIRVQRQRLENAPADGSSIQNTLKTIISKHKTEAYEGDIPVLKGDFKVLTLNNRDVSSLGITMNIDHVIRRISGFSGCNSYHLTYKQKRRQLRFSEVAATKKACPPLGSTEKEFFITFKQGDNFTWEDGILTIYDLENPILTATAE